MTLATALRLISCACALFAGLASARNAAATSIELIYDGPALSGPIMSGLTSSAALATAKWESYFGDPVTLHFTMTTTSSLPSSVLGYFDVDPVTSPFGYSTVKGALMGDKTSATDFSAVSKLQPGSSVMMISNDTTTAPTGRHFYGAPTTFNSTLRLTCANQKALGLLAGSAGGMGADGSIVLNSAKLADMDFDPSDGITFGKIDMTALLIHELAHGMGFISGVDHIDFAGSDGGGHSGGDFPHDYSGETIFTVLDLFRYSEESKTFFMQPPVGKVLDWAAGTSPIFGDNPFFSIDGAATKLAFFSTGAEFGDGYQAQHWKDSSFVGPPYGILDPSIGSGELGVVSSLDVMALDAIGWTVVTVPEPGSVVLFSMGLIAMVAVGRRRMLQRGEGR